MSQLVAGEPASIHFLRFFASTICNPLTWRAYGRAISDFLALVPGSRGAAAARRGLDRDVDAESLAPTAKLRLAAIRHLFDLLLIRRVIPINLAISVRGLTHSVRRGKMFVLDPTEAGQLLDSIDAPTPVGLRDRALIGLMVFSFAWIGAVLNVRVEEVFCIEPPAVGSAA